jgi:O-antigen/teichoic acid export membrane protein
MNRGMSLKKNILANYISQIYVAVIGIVMLPFYLKYMGTEAYGLIGFFTMLQAWFLLLDMGLTPTMARETARFQGAGTNALNLHFLLRSLEFVFFAVALLGGACLVLGAEFIAGHWLQAEKLPRDEVANSIRLMALVMMLRWMGEIYRGVIAGFERMVWLGGFSSAIATTRFVLVIPIFIWVGSDISEFFLFQLFVSTIEVPILMRKAYALLPLVPASAVRWSWTPLRKVMKFSLMMALASAVWVTVSQTDKLLLSGLLSLSDYGWFSLTVMAAGGVLLLAGPIAAALLPRLSALHAQGNETALLSLYRDATQWIGLAVWPVCGVLTVQAERVLWMWTGDVQLAAQAAPTLSLYAMGNGVMAIGAIPYYLQFAKGQLRLHLVGTVLFVTMLLPCMIISVARFGALGAGWTWLFVNILYLLVWTPIVHARYATGLHGQWLIRDVAPIAICTFAAVLASRWLPWPEQRLLSGIQLLLVSGLILMAGAAGSSWVRARLLSRLRNERLIKNIRTLFSFKDDR